MDPDPFYTLPELNSAIHKSRDYRQDYHHKCQLEQAAVTRAIGGFELLS